MPTNLPPDYFAEEKKLRQARTPDEKIAILERMLSIAPHHKGTDHLIAQLRSKISKLKEEKERRPAVQRKADLLYNVKREGAGQVLFIGFPNSGKSSLVSRLSGSFLEVGDYPFTTRVLQARMMRYHDIWIQLVDTPALGDESTAMWFGNMVRKVDALVMVLALSEEIELEYDLMTEEVKRHVPDLDGGSESVVVALNRLDLQEFAPALLTFETNQEGRSRIIPVSATNDVNLHLLRDKIFESLRIVRVYSKLPGKKPDMDAPFVLKKGGTITDLAAKIHRDFSSDLRYAKLWRSDEYNGMMAGKDFVLKDGDIVELHTSKT